MPLFSITAGVPVGSLKSVIRFIMSLISFTFVFGVSIIFQVFSGFSIAGILWFDTPRSKAVGTNFGDAVAKRLVGSLADVSNPLVRAAVESRRH